ncbi:MAG: glycosyltransferase [Candidatus Sericytochromatia bacterium]
MSKTISLCMIVKDAEDTLEQSLNSVKDIVDDIVIIDTGSTDNTKKLLKSYNSKVFDFNWNDNFSDARNFALSKVETDWVLILDSDEVLKGNKDKLREIINQDYKDKTPIFFLDIFSHTIYESKQFDYFQKQIRLFPKNTNIVFKNSVHEEIIHPEGISNFESFSAQGLVIKHYLNGGLKSRSKRNVLILKKENKINPNNFYYNYHMAKECIQHGLWTKASQHYQSAIESPDEKNEYYISEICTDLIKILYKQGEFEEALNECIRRESICYINPEYWLTYGYLALRQGDFECAKECFIKCIETNSPADILIQKIESITWKPEMLLGYTHLRLKEYELAKEHLENALIYTNSNWQLYFYLGIAYKNLKELESSDLCFEQAEKIVPEEFKKDLQFGMLLNSIMGSRFDKANEIVQQIVEELGLSEHELQLLDEDDFE